MSSGHVDSCLASRSRHWCQDTCTQFTVCPAAGLLYAPGGVIGLTSKHASVHENGDACALQAYVSRMAGLLQLSNGHEESQAGKQVEALVIESVRLAAAKSLLDPVGLQQVFQARMRECRLLTQRSEPVAEMWPNILVRNRVAHSW